MASIINVDGKYKAQIVRKGHPRVSKTFPTKAAAQQWAIHRESVLLGTTIAVDGKNTLGQALVRYRDTVSPKRRGARWEVIRLNKFLGTPNRKSSSAPLPFVFKKLDEVVPDDVGQWRDAELLRGMAPESVLREMGLLSAVFEVARKEWRWCRHNPMKDTSKRGLKQKGKKRLLQASEIEAIVGQLGYTEGAPVVTVGAEIALEFLIALETGMRDGELLTLTWDAVHLPRRYLHLDKSKNGDERDVPLSKRAVELFGLLQGRNQDKVFTVKSQERDSKFRKARTDAGLDQFTFHQTRHTAITRLAKKVDVLDLAKMVGHRDLKSLLIYYNADAEALASKLD